MGDNLNIDLDFNGIARISEEVSVSIIPTDKQVALLFRRLGKREERILFDLDGFVSATDDDVTIDKFFEEGENGHIGRYVRKRLVPSDKLVAFPGRVGIRGDSRFAVGRLHLGKQPRFRS